MVVPRVIVLISIRAVSEIASTEQSQFFHGSESAVDRHEVALPFRQSSVNLLRTERTVFIDEYT
jgi:hypothetical protein